MPPSTRTAPLPFLPSTTPYTWPGPPPRSSGRSPPVPAGTSWFTDGSANDPRPGGSYKFVWHGFGPDRVDLTSEGRVVEAVPNARFAFDWASGAGTTRVVFTLEPRGPGTVVRVREEGYSWSDADVRACLECAAGWGEALTLLRFRLEHGVRYGDVPPA